MEPGVAGARARCETGRQRVYIHSWLCLGGGVPQWRLATSLRTTCSTVLLVCGLLVEIGNGGGNGVVAVDKLSGPDQNAMERESGCGSVAG